jgi:hypothetical protein
MNISADYIQNACHTENATMQQIQNKEDEEVKEQETKRIEFESK